MVDRHYTHPRLADIYDTESGWSIDRDFYLSLAGPPPQTILEIGCGTGLISRAYAARGHKVTGLDPAPAMLDAGRRAKHGDRIDWVEGYSQDFELGKQFDLIFMTGHAFQVLLTDRDVRDTFASMRGHLKPGGLIAFESRNRTIDWAAEWGKSKTLVHAGETVHLGGRILRDEPEWIEFESLFGFADETLVSTSLLRFMTRDRIEACLEESKLKTERLLGDWEGGGFDPESSREMIFLVRAA